MARLELKFEDKERKELIQLDYEGINAKVFDSMLMTIKGAIAEIQGNGTMSYSDMLHIMMKPREDKTEVCGIMPADIAFADEKESVLEPENKGREAERINEEKPAVFIDKDPDERFEEYLANDYEEPEFSEEVEAEVEKVIPRNMADFVLEPKPRPVPPKAEENEWQQYVKPKEAAADKPEEDWTGKMNKKQVAATLGVNDKKLDNMMQLGKFPKADGKFGIKCYWLRTTVSNYIDNPHKVMAASKDQASSIAKDVLKDIAF